MWQRVLGDAHERTLWERIRWIVSAVLTRPHRRGDRGRNREAGAAASGARSAARLLLVLDSSWSMRARLPTGGTRWERAVEEARAMAAASDTQEIAVATTADGIVEDRPAIARASIARSPGSRRAAAPMDRGRTSPTPGRRTSSRTAHAARDAAGLTVHSVFVPAGERRA